MLTVSQQAVTDGITKPGTGITDLNALVLEIVFTAIFLIGHPDRLEAECGAGRRSRSR